MNRINKKTFVLIVVFVLFIAYQVSANYIFTYLLSPEGEASRVNIVLPENTSSEVRFWIDNVRHGRVAWKDMLMINGWAFIEWENRLHYEMAVIIRSADNIYLYDSLTRHRDLARVFDSDSALNLNQSGFVSFIPLEAVRDGVYQVGVLLQNRYTGDVFYRMNPARSFVKQGAYIQFPVDATVFDLSEMLSVNLPDGTARDVRMFVDSVTVREQSYPPLEVLHIHGWAFREGMDRADYRTIVVLDSGEMAYAFEVSTALRHGLVSHFEGLGDNLELSGFDVFVPIDAIDDGVYRIGVLLQNMHTGEEHFIPGRAFEKNGAQIEFPAMP